MLAHPAQLHLISLVRTLEWEWYGSVPPISSEIAPTSDELPGRVGQQAAFGIATERSGTTRSARSRSPELAVGVVPEVPPSRRRDCQSAGTPLVVLLALPSSSLLMRLLKGHVDSWGMAGCFCHQSVSLVSFFSVSSSLMAWAVLS